MNSTATRPVIGPWKRIRAGYYTSGNLTVEYLQTAYGDKGWIAWVGGEWAVDYPRQTKAEAIEALRAELAAR